MANRSAVSSNRSATSSRRYSVMDYPNSLEFNGTSDDVVCDGNEVSNGSSTWTMQAVFKLSAATPVDYIYVEGNSGDNNPFTGIAVHTSGVLRGLISNDIAVILSKTSSVVVTDNKWHDAIFVRNGNTVDLYLDGVDLGSATDGSFGDNPVTTNTTTIGALQRIAESNHFKGGVALARSWSVALTNTEALGLQIDGAVPQPASIVKEYLFADGAGGTLTDTGSGGNNGTINGATWNTTTISSNRSAVGTNRTSV